MVCPDVFEMLLVDAVVKHQLQGFGADSLVPKWLSYPVAHFTVVFSDWDVAGFMGVVADAADSFASLFQHNRPCRFIMEECPDYLPTFFYRLMRRPSIKINREKLDPKTWSPMMKDYSAPVISLTVRDLLRYTLSQSDNNASNIMFKNMLNTAQTDSFIAKLIPHSSFQIAYTEEEMSADHDRAYFNYTSPLGAAMLMNRLFTESLISNEKQDFIKNALKECKTGIDRIVAPLLDKEGVVIAHKTGSGYVNENGILAAQNDVAYICLPNKVCYTLAVFVKDFKGNESQASQYVAHISEVVYSLLIQNSAIP